MKPTLCIIGGKGKMGEAFAKLFQSHDCETLVVDVDTRLTFEEAAPKADIIMVSVPISITVEVIAEVAPLIRDGGMICDLTSIKGPAVAAMAEHAPDKVEVLGLHPMCGPKGIEDLTDQVVAACKVTEGKWTDWMLDFLGDRGAKLEMTTAEDHDRVMAVVQGMTHLSSIAGGMALKDLQVDMQEALHFSSPVYKLRFGMIGRVLSQDSRLYAEIAIENPQTLGALKAYKSSVDTLLDAVENKDIDAFRSHFDEAADFLGSFKDDAKLQTDELISTMSKH
jgi:prephenate dehydrogenase